MTPAITAAVGTAVVSTTPANTAAASGEPASTAAGATGSLPLRPSGRGRRHQGRRVPTGADDRAPVAAVVALVVLLVVGWPLADVVGGAAPAGEGPATARTGDWVHVAQPGETYWSIAEGLSPVGDLRRTVDELVAANDARPLRAGDRVLVPAGR